MFKDNRWSENAEQVEAFAAFVNKKYFNGELTYTILPDKKRRIVTKKNSIEVKNGNVSYIIQFNYDKAVYNKEDMGKNIFSYMIYISLLSDGINIPDSSYYHAKKTFGRKAEELGCKIGYDKRYGAYIKELPSGCKEYLENMIFDSYNYYASVPTYNEKDIKIKPKGSNSIKWVCPDCGNIARTTRVINILCGDCHVPFQINTK